MFQILLFSLQPNDCENVSYTGTMMSEILNDVTLIVYLVCLNHRPIIALIIFALRSSL